MRYIYADTGIAPGEISHEVIGEVVEAAGSNPGIQVLAELHGHLIDAASAAYNASTLMRHVLHNSGAANRDELRRFMRYELALELRVRHTAFACLIPTDKFVRMVMGEKPQ